MHNVIVINTNYTYLGTTSAETAMRWLVTGKAVAMKLSDKVFRTVSEAFAVPLVVRLISLVRQVYKRRVQWSKRNVMIRDGHTCVYCGSEDDLDIDHVVPKAQGGKNKWENCVTSCRDCNREKRDRTPNQAGMFFKRRGWRPSQPTVMEFIQLYQVRLGIDKVLKQMGIYD